MVHLLGSHDVATTPDQVIDLEQFPNAVPITVQNATHGSIATPGSDTEGPLRRAFVGEPKSNRDVKIEEPAEGEERKGYSRINEALCVGCRTCMEVCKFDAIEEAS